MHTHTYPHTHTHSEAESMLGTCRIPSVSLMGLHPDVYSGRRRGESTWRAPRGVTLTSLLSDCEKQPHTGFHHSVVLPPEERGDVTQISQMKFWLEKLFCSSFHANLWGRKSSFVFWGTKFCQSVWLTILLHFFAHDRDGVGEDLSIRKLELYAFPLHKRNYQSLLIRVGLWFSNTWPQNVPCLSSRPMHLFITSC